jgi:alpha-D-ribose 1-methylphosphonate 5-triphosphate diphosphatase
LWSLVVSMATLNAAKALAIDTFYGSIEVGKIADLIIVEIYDDAPTSRQSFIKGERVFNNNYFN